MIERKLSVADLTLRDVFDLVKHFLGWLLTCGLVFVLPYLLFRGTAYFATTRFGEEATSQWIAWGVLAIFILLIVANLSGFLQSLSEFFGDCARLTKGLSLAKRITVLMLALLYLLAWRNLPEFAFFLTVLLLFPVAATFDRYQDILRKKRSAIVETK
jgi:uncharacterized membrane protein YedE/YeeE